MKCLTILCSAIFILTGSLWAYPSCSPELQPALKQLYSLQETRQIIQQVEATGAFKIQAARLGKQEANAAWSCMERTIYINLSNPRSQGSLIRSILFEMHNALSQKEFDRLDSLAAKRALSRDHYIQAVERIEHQNALKTIALLEKGRAVQTFSMDTHWPILKNFEEHFAVQVQSGHAGQVGQLYDILSNQHYFKK